MSDQIDTQIQIEERVRKLEVMSQSKVAKPRAWHPSDDVTDAITRMVIALSAWQPSGTDPYGTTRTPYPTLNGPAQRYHALLSDPYTGWSPDTMESWNDFMVVVGAMPMSYLSLDVKSAAGPGDYRPDYVNGVPVSQEVINGSGVRDTYNKFVYIYGLKEGGWFYAPPGYTESNASRLTAPPLAGDTIYVDSPPRAINGGGSYVRIPENPLPWTNTFLLLDNAVAAFATEIFPCGNSGWAGWPRPDGSGPIVATGFLGIRCDDYESAAVPNDSGQLMGLIANPGSDGFSVTPPAKKRQIKFAPSSEGHDRSDSYPGFAEVKRRVEKYAPTAGGGEIQAWSEAWADTALMKEHEDWQTLEHNCVLRGRVEAGVKDKHVHFRGFLDHPWQWDFLGPLLYFRESEVPPPPYRPYPFVLWTERGDPVRCTAEIVFGDWAADGLWAIYAGINVDHVLITRDGDPPANQIVFDGLSWQSNVLLY